MTNTSSYFDMVEGTQKRKQEDESEILQQLGLLVRMLTPRRISVKDVEYDVKKFEEDTEGWESLTDVRKIEEIMKNAEKDIIKWNFYEGFEMKSYESWKRRLLERFSVDPIFFHEYFNFEQKEDEGIKDFALRVEAVGLRLKVSPDVRFAILYKGIRKYSYEMRSALVKRDGDEISHKVISLLAETESIIIQKEEKFKVEDCLEKSTIRICKYKDSSKRD